MIFLERWIEIVVYLKADYSQSESIYVRESLSHKKLTKLINKKFGQWYFYDIIH